MNQDAILTKARKLAEHDKQITIITINQPNRRSKMAKHTFGDWGVAQVNCGEWEEIVSDVNGCQVNIAEVMFGSYGMMEPDGKGGSREYASYEITKEEAAANARMMAAAPSMYGALLQLVTALKLGEAPTSEDVEIASRILNEASE